MFVSWSSVTFICRLRAQGALLMVTLFKFIKDCCNILGGEKKSNESVNGRRVVQNTCNCIISAWFSLTMLCFLTIHCVTFSHLHQSFESGLFMLIPTINTLYAFSVISMHVMCLSLHNCFLSASGSKGHESWRHRSSAICNKCITIWERWWQMESKKRCCCACPAVRIFNTLVNALIFSICDKTLKMLVSYGVKTCKLRSYYACNSGTTASHRSLICKSKYRFCGSRERPVSKSDNLTAICESIV
jgi:hypothetical protein